MTQKIYSHRESPIVFRGTGGGNVLFTPQNKANNAGRYSTQWQRPDPGAGLYLWRAKTKLAVAAAVGAFLTVYIANGDGVDIDAGLGASDADMPAADRRRNLTPIGVVIADAATVGPFYGSGVIELLAPYITVAWWNEMGQTLTNTVGDHEFSLTPIPWEIQNNV